MDTTLNSPAETSDLVEAATPMRPSGMQPQPCPNCGGGQKPAALQPPAAALQFIYALGRIESRFPLISVEKEFAQLLGSSDTKGKTDRAAFRHVLSEPQNRYLARQLCWVMSISGQETYILVPREPSDLDLLIDSLRQSPDSDALDAVIGVRGPVASPDRCNGLTLPVVVFDKLYSFDRASLIKALPTAKKDNKEFEAVSAEVLDRILSSTDNAGAGDMHRAVNYLALRDPGIYLKAADCYGRDLALTSIEGRSWRLSVTRKIVEVIFTFTHRKNEFVEKYAVRVDVNDEFPFLVSKIAPYFDH